MSKTRIAVIGDVHLGRPHRQCAADLVEAWFRRVVARAVQRDCRILVITGDLFDKKVSEPESVLACGEQLLRHAVQSGLRVVMVWGNHDVASGLSEKFPVIDGVHVAGTDPELIEVPGVDVVFPAASVAVDRDLRRLVPDFPATFRPALAILHSSVETKWSKSRCLPTTAEEMRARGYAGWVLGHVHDRIHIGECPFIGYPGAHWRRRSDIVGGSEYTEVSVPSGGNPATATIVTV